MATWKPFPCPSEGQLYELFKLSLGSSPPGEARVLRATVQLPMNAKELEILEYCSSMRAKARDSLSDP